MILLELYQHLGTKSAKHFSCSLGFTRELASFTKCKKIIIIMKEQMAGVMDANTREGGVP